MKNYRKLGVVALMLSGLMASSSAQAISTLSGDLNIDDIMEIYISEDDTVAGEAITTNNSQFDEHWWGASNFSNVELEKDVSYFLHVKGTNALGFITGFIGNVNLTGGEHVFADDSATSATGDNNWLVSSTGWGIDLEATTTRTQINPWSHLNLAGVDSVDWIWDSQDNEANDEAYFTLAINAVPVGVGDVPVPGAVWLFGTGLLGFIGMRKKAIKA